MPLSLDNVPLVRDPANQKTKFFFWVTFEANRITGFYHDINGEGGGEVLTKMMSLSLAYWSPKMKMPGSKNDPRRMAISITLSGVSKKKKKKNDFENTNALSF